MIVSYLTGNGGLGTYLLSNSCTAATGDTVTGLFTGFGNLPVGGAVPLLGTLPVIPYGSAGTIMAYLPEAMCSRAVSITPN